MALNRPRPPDDLRVGGGRRSSRTGRGRRGVAGSRRLAKLAVFVYRGDFSETDLRARFLVGRQWDGYALITSTLFELAEASVVVATEVAVGVSPGRQVSESGAL